MMRLVPTCLLIRLLADPAPRGSMGPDGLSRQVSAAREYAIRAAILASHIQVHNAGTCIKKAASLANQERRNSRGGVGHAKAGTKTSRETRILKNAKPRKERTATANQPQQEDDSVPLRQLETKGARKVSMYSLVQFDIRHKNQFRQAAMRTLQIFLHCHGMTAGQSGTD
jgi:hypothetical protein